MILISPPLDQAVLHANRVRQGLRFLADRPVINVVAADFHPQSRDGKSREGASSRHAQRHFQGGTLIGRRGQGEKRIATVSGPPRRQVKSNPFPPRQPLGTRKEARGLPVAFDVLEEVGEFVFSKVDEDLPVPIRFKKTDALDRAPAHLEPLIDGICGVLQCRRPGVEAIDSGIVRQSRGEVDRQAGEILQRRRKLAPIQSPLRAGRRSPPCRLVDDPSQNLLLLGCRRLFLPSRRHPAVDESFMNFRPKRARFFKPGHSIQANLSILSFCAVALDAVSGEERADGLLVVGTRRARC